MDRLFAKFASVTARITGSPPAFIACVALVLVWAVSGPLFQFSETWQLVINTGTTIITFLMVFLIQNSQNRDSEALQTKLDELIRSSNAKNKYVGIEKLTDHELDALRSEAEKAANVSEETVEKVEAVKSKRKAGARKPAAAKAAPRARKSPPKK
ncbi:low affinity Fe/Cu permease [Caulobacter ginsengisoli]|uniref:Low affinity Fe/Cu permease n=1 Tax=Caulobacter ginsengisoli TaxID=400775 RepID=A0ABU0IKW0_9CAUL|nr:low affinity iron permease family protein [Caulobacter ginsengisoli]MDQ0462650.1 low affinity Fe/Cu permease [Caulobacter ginsengisoli]